MATWTILVRHCAAGFLAACAATCAQVNSCLADSSAVSPTGGGASVRLEPVPRAVAARAPRPVYVCRDAIPVVFSDRPCGPVTERRSLDIFEPGPGQAATTIRLVPSASTRPRKQPIADELHPAGRDDQCKRLRDQLETLDDQMRSGYSAREAARLWTRWRAAKARIRDARC